MVLSTKIGSRINSEEEEVQVEEEAGVEEEIGVVSRSLDPPEATDTS